MSSLSAKTLIKADFTTNWLTTPWFDLTDYLNLSDVPIADATNTWLGLEFPPAVETRVSLGTDTQARETGLIVVHVMVPDGFASTAGDTLVDQARTFLRWKRLGALFITDINTPISYQNDLGAWRDYTFTANYYYDIIS
ncbi:MAG: hypothetical protein ACHQYQ_06330 [Bacteriovoracales bacterium]